MTQLMLYLEFCSHLDTVSQIFNNLTNFVKAIYNSPNTKVQLSQKKPE